MIPHSEIRIPHFPVLQPHRQFVWSVRYTDALVRRDTNTNEDDLCDDETLYALGDANFNTTALVNAAGTVLERYVYDPYGRVTVMDGAWTARSGSLYESTVLFAGYWRDSETGLYHVRNRMYHVRLGLWLQRDPEGYVDGMSLYEYVRSRPIGLLDWSGASALEAYEKAGWELEYVAYACDHKSLRTQLKPNIGGLQPTWAGALHQQSKYTSTTGNRAGIEWEPIITMTKGNQRKAFETKRPHDAFQHATFEGPTALEGKGEYVKDPRGGHYEHVRRMDGMVETDEWRLKKMKQAIEGGKVDIIEVDTDHDYCRDDYFPPLTPAQKKAWREEWAKQYEKGRTGTDFQAGKEVRDALKESKAFHGDAPPLPVPPDIHVPLSELKPGPVGPKRDWPPRTKWPD